MLASGWLVREYRHADRRSSPVPVDSLEGVANRHAGQSYRRDLAKPIHVHDERYLSPLWKQGGFRDGNGTTHGNSLWLGTSMGDVGHGLHIAGAVSVQRVQKIHSWCCLRGHSES